MEPASIRTKNPGAMWGRVGKRPSADKVVATNAPIPLRWGSRRTLYLNDGTGQGNNIAIFDTWVDGICAQLDLWRSSPKYRNKKFRDAIAVWSGGNHVSSYIAYVLARVPGMTADTVMNDGFWMSPMGVGFLKAQAGHEAGKPYPAPAEDWFTAQKLVMKGVATQKKATRTGGSVVAGGSATGAAHQAGLPLWAALAIGVGVAAVVFAVWYWKHKNEEKRP